MKLIYFGTAEFAVPALVALAPHVCLIVSQPDRPSGRNLKLTPSPVKMKANELGLPCLTPEKARDKEFVEHLQALQADALVVAAYGQILSQSVLDSARFGGINLHGSLLPAWRGAAPIQRAIEAGDATTGVTLMQMDKGMDTGDEIARVETSIGPDETYGELTGRLADMAADLAAEWMPKITTGNYNRVPQQNELATQAPKVTKAEAELDWEQDVTDNYRRFRAFTPSPGPFFKTKLGLVKLSAARALQTSGHEAPGTILKGGQGCLVAFSGGAIDFLELQPDGKRRMSGKDFLNGLRLKPGDSLR